MFLFVPLSARDNEWGTKKHVFKSLAPHCESNALIRATVGVVSATFGTVSYFALSKYAPMSEQRQVLFPSNFGTLVLLSQFGGGGRGGRYGGVRGGGTGGG